MSLYSKALRHINMDRVKELREENIKKQKLAEEKLQEEIIRAELKKIHAEQTKHVNWRRELDEAMTTSGMGMINLGPNINDLTAADDKNSDAAPAPLPQDGTLSNNTWTMNSTPPEGSAAVIISLSVDLSRSDTISTQVHFDNAACEEMSVVLDGPVGSGLQQVFDLSVPPSGTGSANPNITINPSLRIKGVTLSYSALGAINFEGNRVIGTNAIRISSTVPFRSNPMSLFVSLDNPEAAAFIRDTLSDDSLTPEQKKKKLEEMLGASAEYLIKKFGEGIFTGAIELSDIDIQQSFVDIAAGQTLYGPGSNRTLRPDGTSGFPEPGEMNQDHNGNWYEYKPGEGWMPIPSLKFVKGSNQGTQNAHYEPEGEVIMEKKKLKSPKSLLDKIPGYYDDKPAPLGFPIEEPPKMKNGMHPDLVDGKKVANRYNRLDPTSAKAMPKTGNPHIDKKVKAAAKKPK